MKAFLEEKGFRVSMVESRLEIWSQESGRYLGGFYWTKARDARPGGWRFDVALMDTYSVRDFHNAVDELERVERLLPKLWAAWKAFSSSRSDKRWVAYRSLVAPLFLRQNSEE
mgnify:CR=1 FL=1